MGRPTRLGPESASSEMGRLGSTMKSQSMDAPMITNLLMDMVLSRVFRRLGFLSTHLPTADEKQMEATVLTIPL